MANHKVRLLLLLLVILLSIIFFIISEESLPENISWTAFSGYNRSRDGHLLNIGKLWGKTKVLIPSNNIKGNSVIRPQTTPAENPISLLFKKNFHKIPQWDFEDIYHQDAPPSLTTCPQSLRNSKDEDFQKAFLPNIRVFMHKDNFNIKDWNRLSHFNNPFGFMEMKYDDVLDAVKLIPKPTEPLLLPKPGGDGCVHCAVVGTGGILNGSKMGAEIDAHDYVFRVNGAAIKGYEEDVGNKTSVYVHTSFSITQSLYILKKYGYQSAPHDKGIKYVLIPEGMRDFQWLKALFKEGNYQNTNPRNYYSGQYNESRYYVLHQDFMRYVRNRFLKSDNLNKGFWDIVRPTNGAFAVFLALHSCDTVSAYGFMTEDYRKYSNYYVERHQKTNVIFYANHDYILEKNLWTSLHVRKILKLFMRTGS
nr:alpha-N-acetylgalactosaminide alpha-2,6-sialyltransferase 1 [Nothobranchius furzeri]